MRGYVCICMPTQTACMRAVRIIRSGTIKVLHRLQACVFFTLMCTFMSAGLVFCSNNMSNYA